MTSDMTTLKVRRSTREAVSSAARDAGLTVDAYLQKLLEEEQWRRRMARARADMIAADLEYASESAGWDAVSADGLSAD